MEESRRKDEFEELEVKKNSIKTLVQDQRIVIQDLRTQLEMLLQEQSKQRIS